MRLGNRILAVCVVCSSLVAGLPQPQHSVNAAAPTGKRVALLVGVNKYEKRNFRDLEFAERDVTELAAVLKKSGYEIHLLTGDGEGTDRATLENVQKSVLAALKGRTKHDLVLVGLAGHGLQLEIEENKTLRSESFYCPVDAVRSDKETLLSMGWLFDQIDARGGGQNVVLVDACREDPARGRGLDGSKVQALPEGLAVLFGCRAGQKSYETKNAGGGHGVFFHFVLEGLRGAAANARGDITWAGLSEYVSDQVETNAPNLMEEEKLQQVPNEVKNLQGRSPVLARIERLPDVPKLNNGTTIDLPDGQPRPGGHKLHFLGIGVTDFRKQQINAGLKARNKASGGLEVLSCAHNDVIRLGEALAGSLKHRRWNEAPRDAFDLGYFATLTSTDATTLEDIEAGKAPAARPAKEHPTEANIRAKLAELAEVAGPEDLAVVMFSGHGTRGNSSVSKFVAEDTESIDPNVGLNTAAIQSLLGALPCRTLLLYDAPQSAEESRDWAGMSAGPIVLLSADADEFSLEHMGYLHGLFAQALLEPLTGTRAKIRRGAKPSDLKPWDSNGDGWLSVTEWCEFTRLRTLDLCDEVAGCKFNPQLINSMSFHDADDFRLMPAHPLPKSEVKAGNNDN